MLIVRIWFEDGRDDPQLRIRMTGRADLDRDAQDSRSTSTIEEALVYVRDWMEGFARIGR